MIDRVPVENPALLSEGIALLKCGLWSPGRLIEWASRKLPHESRMLPLAVLSPGATRADVEDALREVAEAHTEVAMPDAPTAARLASGLVARAWLEGAISTIDASRMIVEISEEGRFLAERYSELYAWLDEMDDYPGNLEAVETKLEEILTSLA